MQLGGVNQWLLTGEDELADEEPVNQNKKILKEELINQKLISMKLASEGEIKEPVNEGEIEELASEEMTNKN